MVSKGLDFDNVSVVGIIAADSLLISGFRSHERGFQLMMRQVDVPGGEAGKSFKPRSPNCLFIDLLSKTTMRGFITCNWQNEKFLNILHFTG